MRLNDDPANLTSEERRLAIAKIFAAGILRLRRASISPAVPASENPSIPEENRLEPVGDNLLTVHVG